MREVHEIAKGMVQPWMIWGVLAELLLGSFAVPVVVFMFTGWWSVLFAIPVLMVGAYRLTAKDMFRLAVAYGGAKRPVNPRSAKRWEGARVYAPR